MGDGRQRFTLWLLVALALAASSCGPKRISGPGRIITDCDYLVVTEKHAHRFADEAEEVLSKSFVVITDDDVRLKSPALKQKACLLSIEWSRGFWKSSATVEVKDYSNRALMHRSYVAGGMLYAGYSGDIMEALEDVAAARAEGGPVSAAARAEPLPVAEPQRGVPQASKAQRLTELNDLKERGLITDDEYSEQRTKILNER
jgi:hypothetical protein